MKLQLNFQIVRFLNYKQRFSDALPQTLVIFYIVRQRFVPNGDWRIMGQRFFPVGITIS